MNHKEKQMLDILKRGKEKYGVIATKAEFEAEGTRPEELLRLLEISNKADLGIGLKIGGCEALRDMYEAKQLGVDYIIAPMVETPYALGKFIHAKEKVFNKEEAKSTKFLFNLETITAYRNQHEMLNIAAADSGCDGVVFGRVDFSGSLGLPRSDAESNLVTKKCLKICHKSKNLGLDFVVGGAVSKDSLTNLKRLNERHLTRFETRKIIFMGDAVNLPDISKGITDALHFQLLWLLNKKEYYGELFKEDDYKIKSLKSHCQSLRSD